METHSLLPHCHTAAPGSAFILFDGAKAAANTSSRRPYNQQVDTCVHGRECTDQQKLLIGSNP